MTGHRIIAGISKNQRSETMVSLSDAGGINLIHLRLWARKGRQLFPTRKGIVFHPERSTVLIAAVERAVAVALQRELDARKVIPFRRRAKAGGRG